MAEPFATATRAMVRPTIQSADMGQVGDLLRRASGIIRADCPGVDARMGVTPATTESEALAELVADICIDMAARALAPAALPEGVSQMSQAAGTFNTSVTMAEPASRLYLTKAERDRIRGRRVQRAGSAWMGQAL